MSLTPFKELIRENCGLVFEETRESLLAQGIRVRLAKRGLDSPDRYLEILGREPEEFRNLVSLITVNETYFFREGSHFTVLTERLLPEILPSRRGDPVRILSAGCSTGEEAYTIAMVLRRKYGPAAGRLFSVIGCDIDEEALRAARRGCYAQHSFRGVSGEIQEQFFEREGDRHRFRDFGREGVSFRHLNICDEAFPAAFGDVDVIFYRNVSIYFEPEAQKRIFRNLASLLREGGYLFLSSTETFFHNIGVLSLVEKDGIFLYRKGLELQVEERRKGPAGAGGTGRPGTPGSVRPSAAAPGAAAPSPAAGLPRAPAPAGEPARRSEPARVDEALRRLFDTAILLAQEKSYDAALGRLEQILQRQPAFAQAHLLKTGVLVNAKRFDEAAASGLRCVEIDRLCLEGYLFLGLIAKIREAFAEAKRRFKEALYVRPSCWIAHFHLGEIYREEGDLEQAAREFEIVIRLVRDQEPDAHALAFFTFSCSPEQIVHLCRHNLAALKERAGGGGGE